eukprot:PhM_4_TR10827/c0_g1_i2/m.63949/K04412/STK3, MST2; serine/threonine kinase 3
MVSEEEVASYLRRHQVHSLLDDLVGELMSLRPENILRHIEHWAVQKQDDIDEAKERAARKEMLLLNKKREREEVEVVEEVAPAAAAAADNEQQQQESFEHDEWFVTLPLKYSSPVGLYDIGDLIGKGHYSSVFRATRRSDDLPVAIKVVPVTGEWVTWESDTLRACQSSGNVVRFIDHHYHPADREFWLVMNCVAQTLEHFAVNIGLGHMNAADRENVIRDVMRQLASAIACMHEQGIVHLDVKPANVLVSQEEGESGHRYLFQLADFGTAMYVEDNVEQLGDFAYMAPEIYGASGTYHPSNDTWGMGLTAVYLAEGPGAVPFNDGRFAVEEGFRIYEGTCLSPCVREPLLWSQEFVHFVSCCFVRDHVHRWTAQEMLLHPFLTKG